MKTHKSDILDEFFKEKDSLLEKKVAFKMRIAARIDDALKAKRMRKKELAQLMGKTSSEISKWLSGTQNFTIETLIEIEHYLNVELINPQIKYCNPCNAKIVAAACV